MFELSDHAKAALAEAAATYGVDPEAYTVLFCSHFHPDVNPIPVVTMDKAIEALQIQAKKSKC